MAAPPAGPIPAIGLMSGTSQDGVDVALTETDGDIVAQFGATAYRAHTGTERVVLGAAIAASATLTNRTERPGVVAQAEIVVNTADAEAVECLSDVAVVGFHGQTVLHRPQQHLTIQIGDGGALGRRLGIAVIYDSRRAARALVPSRRGAAVGAGGAGCPANIGGVANVDVVDGNDMPSTTGAPHPLTGGVPARRLTHHARGKN